MGRKRGGSEMSGGDHPEGNPGGPDRREDRKDGKRTRKSRIRRRRNSWEKSSPEQTPSQSRPWDEDRWPRGAHA
ncbi:hypothetical protein NDU88_002760 [Pleurodeles waltl]|uniref:Uncharacterized protein n=1 Tax=Pleurodeles waltl TaxID=8319 RepID=A0AAV7WQF2_PLEWA|nr:hypothetical protein NDU88_002760 [Pleurodeles waltl]